MAVVAGLGSNNPQVGGGFGSLPTPVKLGIVGGGIGLVVFIMRRRGGDSQQENAESQQLLPNTAIMLGSLQQTLLETKGLVGTTAADTSLQLTGAEQNLSAQLDALTGQTQLGLTQLQSSLVNTNSQNTASILDALQGQGNVLAALIGSNATAQASANATFAESLNRGLDSIVAQHNAELAGLDVITQQQGGILQAVNSAKLSPTNPIAPTTDWNVWNGSKFYTSNGTGVFVQNGKLYGVTDQKTFDGANMTMRGWVSVPWSALQGQSAGLVGANVA